MTDWGITRWGEPGPSEYRHEHSDRGGGYCDCGAQRCSFTGCDAYCVHPGAWVEFAELEAFRASNTLAQLKAAATLPPGQWWCGSCLEFYRPDHFPIHGDHRRSGPGA